MPPSAGGPPVRAGTIAGSNATDRSFGACTGQPSARNAPRVLILFHRVRFLQATRLQFDYFLYHPGVFERSGGRADASHSASPKCFSAFHRIRLDYCLETMSNAWARLALERRQNDALGSQSPHGRGMEGVENVHECRSSQAGTYLSMEHMVASQPDVRDWPAGASQ
jgi:hypothetical protein